MVSTEKYHTEQSGFVHAFTCFRKAEKLVSNSISISKGLGSKANNQMNFFSPYSVLGAFSNFNIFVAYNYRSQNVTDKFSVIKVPVIAV